jgi:mono/diheme cytochrome c family protein
LKGQYKMLPIIKPRRRTHLELLVMLSFLFLIAYSVIGNSAHKSPPNIHCPQDRITVKAPADLYAMANPLEVNRGARRAGKELYEDLSNPSCVACHGKKGDGRGQLADQFDPPPRNFACAATIDGVPDGQLHWIIKNGSPGSAMPPFDYLTDEEIWQLVIYLRSLTDHE